MKNYSTIAGKNTYFGAPGANARYVEYELEQEKRLKKKYERKVNKIPPEEKITVTDKDIDEWIESCYTISKEIESEWEEEDQ